MRLFISFNLGSLALTVKTEGFSFSTGSDNVNCSRDKSEPGAVMLKFHK
jgi:hypothetical protein